MTEITAGSHPETDHQLLSGCRADVLRKVNGARKVRRRTIVLDANVPARQKPQRLPLGVKPNRPDASQPPSRRSRKSIAS